MATTSGPVEAEYWQPREATHSTIYVDDQALSRDCFGAQPAFALPEFGVGLNAHSLSIEDEQLLRDLRLLQHAFDSARIVVLTDLETPENIIGAMRLQLLHDVLDMYLHRTLGHS